MRETRTKITTSTAITHWPGVFIPLGVTSQNAVILLEKAEIGEYRSLMNSFILATLKTNLSLTGGKKPVSYNQAASTEAKNEL